ncbi:MAG TPA: hypothetical protein VD994_16060 [Prosthecobacter sp.]|nr:hypothetical protein [Prosthecobacter sp.]
MPSAFTSPTRRAFLHTALTGGAALAAGDSMAAAPSVRIAPFRFDVTPPAGHPLCGGWITPVVDVADSLEAIGFVLLGAGKPIVICAVDWTGIMNDAHVAWRTALAEAAGTDPERVAVQCVHQHDAPLVCPEAERLVAEQNAGLRVVDMIFFNDCLQRARAAITTALPKARPITHVAHGEGIVSRVASNRRVAIGPDGKVTAMRGSACKRDDLISLPEGLIDPMLKTVAFYDGAEKIVACHYYATHPMSHYGKGHVSSDFAGLARKQRQQEQKDCTHLYFTGCGGNIAAGKYNDGSPEARLQLTQRLYEGIVAAEKMLKPEPIRSAAWRTSEAVPVPNPLLQEDQLRAMLANAKNAPANRIRPAMQLAWLRRIAQQKPIVLSALHINDATLLHLPGELFVEYQLRFQTAAPSRFIATSAYGDGGTWYIPTKEAYPKGGYEVSVANVADSTDDLLTRRVRELLSEA